MEFHTLSLPSSRTAVILSGVLVSSVIYGLYKIGGLK